MHGYEQFYEENILTTKYCIHFLFSHISEMIGTKFMLCVPLECGQSSLAEVNSG